MTFFFWTQDMGGIDMGLPERDMHCCALHVSCIALQCTACLLHCIAVLCMSHAVHCTLYAPYMPSKETYTPCKGPYSAEVLDELICVRRLFGITCVAVCCSVMQCVGCSVLQCVAVCCSVLQCVAVCCRGCGSVSWFMWHVSLVSRDSCICVN